MRVEQQPSRAGAAAAANDDGGGGGGVEGAEEPLAGLRENFAEAGLKGSEVIEVVQRVALDVALKLVRRSKRGRARASGRRGSGSGASAISG